MKPNIFSYLKTSDTLDDPLKSKAELRPTLRELTSALIHKIKEGM